MTRNREVAIRHAVGASRRRLLRQFATESLVLALLCGGLHTLWVVVRTADDPRLHEPAVAQAIADLDPNLPLFQVRTMDDVMWEAVSRPRFLTFLLSCFAGIALLLAASPSARGSRYQSPCNRPRMFAPRDPIE